MIEMGEKKKPDNIADFTSERVKKERAAAEEHILRAQGTKKIKEGEP